MSISLLLDLIYANDRQLKLSLWLSKKITSLPVYIFNLAKTALVCDCAVTFLRLSFATAAQNEARIMRAARSRAASPSLRVPPLPQASSPSQLA